MKLKIRKTRRKGFGLVELVISIVVIAILGAGVFAGGAAVIKKSQVSRTTSDLHNFSIAIETFMNETPKIANATVATEGTGETVTDHFGSFIRALNLNLPTEYQINTTAITASSESIQASGGNITVAETIATTVAIYESAKTDAWGNHYYIVVDSGERHGANNSDFYITVISAGADAKTELAGRIGGKDTAEKNIDDVFLLAQYMNGDVSAVTYRAESDKLYTWNSESATNESADKLKELPVGDGCLYSGQTKDSGNTITCPINF